MSQGLDYDRKKTENMNNYDSFNMSSKQQTNLCCDINMIIKLCSADYEPRSEYILQFNNKLKRFINIVFLDVSSVTKSINLLHLLITINSYICCLIKQILHIDLLFNQRYSLLC